MRTNRTEVLGFRVQPAEKAALLAIAKAERRKPSEAIREIIRQEAERRQLWPPPVGEVSR